MVELEHHRVAFPAIRARVRLEVVDEESRPFLVPPLIAHPRLIDVPRPVHRVVLLPVFGPARPAVRVWSSTGRAAHREVRSRFYLVAATAAEPSVVDP